MGTRWKQDAREQAAALVQPGYGGGLARGVAVKWGDTVGFGI